MAPELLLKLGHFVARSPEPTPLALCLREAARLHSSTLTAEVRLAAILADNAVELLLLGLSEDFIFHDRWSTKPEWDYDRRSQLYSSFEAKVVAAVEQGWLDPDQAEIARIGHYIRNNAYHTGELSGDQMAFVWCPLVLKLAIVLARAHEPSASTGVDIDPPPPLSVALNLCASTVLDRIAKVLIGLHEYGTACTGPMPSDDDLDDILAGAEAAWGVGFIETAPGRKKDDVRTMLRSHVFDGSPLPNRQLTVHKLRAWEAEARAHQLSPTLRSTALWWRTVDRRLAVYEKTIELANL